MSQSFGPAALAAALFLFEVLYWTFLSGQRRALERRLTAISPRTFYLVPVPYLARVAILVVYMTLTGAPVLRGLIDNAGWGIATGFALTACQMLVMLRRVPRLPGPAERGEVVLFLGYTLIVIALVEETIFRGALLLAVGDGWVALLASSAAMAAWHIPYYVSVLHPPAMARSLVLVFVVSLLFGVAVIATGSLWASILPHGLGDFAGWVGRRGRAPDRPRTRVREAP